MTHPTEHPLAHVLPDGQHVALGRPRASVLDDPRTQRFRLANFVDRSALPPLQDKIQPPPFAPRMFRNDQVGDCTIAGEANYALLAAAKAGHTPPDLSDQAVVDRYARLTGYNPADPSTDRGAIELDVLNDWRHDPFAGVTLAAFATVDVHDLELVRYAIQLFGAAYVGLALPSSAQAQTGAGRVWDTAPGMVPGSWGGHCVILTHADWTLPVAEFQAATWGSFQRMTEAFWRACGDECYAPLTDQWRDVPGLDYAALERQLGQLGRVQQASGTWLD